MEKEMSLAEKWEKAGLANNFIFYKVMRNNPKECKELLEILLEMEIDHIDMNQEETVIIDPNSKGIRMDVYLKNETQSFNIEMQATDTKELSKRARYYQGVMDVDNLKSGELYSKLKDSYVIFICLDDIFGKGFPLYNFENICEQDKNLKLNDRSYKYFFAACNCDKLLNERQKSFFNLLISNKSNDSFTERLSKLIANAKHNTQWRMQYMEFEREKAYAREAGYTCGWEIGVAEGEKKGLEEGLKRGIAKGKKQGIAEKAIENALTLIKDFNISPEIAAEKMGADINSLLGKLSEK